MSSEIDQPKKTIEERPPFAPLRLPLPSPFSIGETILIQTINERNRRKEQVKPQEGK